MLDSIYHVSSFCSIYFISAIPKEINAVIWCDTPWDEGEKSSCAFIKDDLLRDISSK